MYMVCLWGRALGRSENPEAPVLFGGYNVPLLVEIELTLKEYHKIETITNFSRFCSYESETLVLENGWVRKKDFRDPI